MVHAVVEIVIVAIDAVEIATEAAQNGDIGGLLLLRRAVVMALETLLIAADALFHVVERAVERRMGIAAESMGDQGLAGGEADPAVRLEQVSLLGNGDFGRIGAAVEIFGDSLLELGLYARTQRIADFYLFAIDLNLHGDVTLRS